MGHAMGYLLVRGMQEVAPLYCDLIAGEELSNCIMGYIERV